MDATAWLRVKAVCAGALERTGAARAAYLDEACAGDAALRAEVESLLGAYSRAGEFIEQPALLQLGASLDEALALAAGDLHVAALPHLSAESLADPNIGRPIGSYTIERVIGYGGMGTVYLACRTDREFEQRVAIKMIRRGMDSDLVIRRFRHERQILASLDHPHIARLFDGGTTPDGLPYFVMEHVDGLPIDRYADSHQLPTADRLRLCLDVFEAVQHAHDRAIVHRDLKPSNVLVTADGHPKLLDFGIAKILDSEGDGASTFTHVTRPMTPDYASPEQIQGRPITPATDVYALGLLLYELLTGHRPFRFEGTTAEERNRLVCDADPERPSTAIERRVLTTRDDGETVTVTADMVARLRDGSPAQLRERLAGALDAIVLKALRKEPSERYPSVVALAEDVRRYLEARPVAATRDRWRYQAARVARRYRALVGTAALILLAVLVTVVAMRQWREGVPAAATPGAATAAASTAATRTATDPTAAAEAAARRSVAVIGFRNLTGAPADDWLSTAIAEMLTTELAGDGQVRAVPADRIARAMRDRRMATDVMNGEGLDAPAVEALQQALGVDYLVLGTFATTRGSSGRTLRLDIRVQGQGETPLAGAGIQGDEAQLFALVADAGRDLRQRLGLRASTPESTSAARAAFPASLEATRLYAEGTARLRVLDAVAARERLAQAAVLEPANPLIQRALASAWAALGYDARAAEAAQRAFDAAGALGREERLTVEGRLYEAQRQWAKAADVYRTLWGFFSDNIEYGLQLATAQTSSGRGKEALETIAALRRLPAAAGDPRVDLADAEAAGGLGDFRREAEALGRAAALAERSGARGLVARARLLEGRSYFNQGKPDQARQALDIARRLFEEVGDRAGVASTLNSLGTLLADQRDVASGASMYEASLRQSEEIGDRRAMSAALNNLGILFKDQRRFEEARQAHERALALRREIGDRNWTAVSLSNIGVVYFEQDRFAEAERYYRESLVVAREIGDKRSVVRAQHNLAIVTRELGRMADAQRQLEESLATRREIGDRRGEVMSHVELGVIQLARGDLAAAKASQEAALATSRETRLRTGEGQAMYQLGEIARAAGDLTEARRQHEAALALRREMGETRTVAESAHALAVLTLDEERPREAEQQAQRVLQGLGEEPAVPLRVPLHLLVARARAAQQDLPGAGQALAAAQAAARGSARIDLRVALALSGAEIALSRGDGRTARDLLARLADLLTPTGLALADLERRLLLARVDIAEGRAGAAARLRAVAAEAAKSGAMLVARRADRAGRP